MKITLIGDVLDIDGQGMVIDIAKTRNPNIIVEAPELKFENIQVGGFVFIGKIKGHHQIHGNHIINPRGSHKTKDE